MLCIEEDNHIRLTRGDSAILTLTITDENGEEYLPTDGDLVLFTVKNETHTKDVIIQKRLVKGAFHLAPIDTKDLDFWRYVYDVQLVRVDGFTATVIAPATFEICEEVTD